MKLSRLLALALLTAALAAPAFGFGPNIEPYGAAPPQAESSRATGR